MVYEFGRDLICGALEMWVTDTKKRWPDTHFVTFGEYGEVWRAQNKNNDQWNYRFEERGSGLGDSYNNLEIKWFMNKEFRLAILRDWHQETSYKVIDLTRYDLPAKEPLDPDPQHPVKNWSLINEINQKGLRPPDKPVLINELSKADQDRIARHYPELIK